MKIKVVIIGAVLLIGGLLTYFAVTFGGDSAANSFEATAWDSFSGGELDSHLKTISSSRALPPGKEKEFLAWLFTQHPEKAETFIRAQALKLDNLPWFMSDTAWDLVRSNRYDTGMRILGLARQVFPNDPDVLGFMGIVAYLQGSQIEARRFLEEAETWRRNRPIVDFYLGGLLIMSDTAADRTRGKTILMGLVNGGNAELRELSSLTLLTNTSVPLIREDVTAIIKTLEQDDVLRMGNPNLPIQALRVITTRLVGNFPDKAMEVAELMIQYPNATAEDYLNMVRFAQALGHPEKARKYLADLTGNPSLAEGLEGDIRLQRLVVAQAFLDGRFEEGLAGLRELVANPDVDGPAIQETFQAISKSELPMSTEQELLEIYLDLPVGSLRTSITVLARLIQIAPLQREKYVSYAITNLLNMDPATVGTWLTDIDASAEIIAALTETERDLSEAENIVLVNAYLKEEDPAEAQAALNKAGYTIDPAMKAFLQSRIFLQQGDVAKATPFWEEAYQLVAGGTQFPLMKALGLLALDLDQPVNALQLLYTAFTAGIPFAPDQAAQLIQLTLSYGNLRQSIRVAEYLAERYPDSPIHKNNLAYFRFLAKESVEESVEVMRKLVEEYPDIHQYRLTLALGLVRSGRTNEASRLLKSTNIDWSSTSTRGLLIYAVVLAASDQRVVATGLIQNIDMSVLIPEEKALLEEF